MSAQKRSHQVQHAQRNGQSNDVHSSPSKRLKRSHAKADNALASLLNPTPKKLQAVVTNGVQSKPASRVDESRATITATTTTNGVNGSSAEDAIEIEEDVSDDSDSDDSVEEEAEVPHTNGVVTEEAVEDVEMTNGVINKESEEERDEAPSFADMLKARNPDVIDVNTKLVDGHTQSQALTRPITGLSLATVLQQALKTDDKEALEKCFSLRDTQAIRNTIQRIPSPLAADLLTRITERMHKRPGRSGAFMLWIQWTLVAHGGYLASQPEVVRKLKSLNQVIRQRAQGLVPLVQLKGKLDLLSAQMDLRKHVDYGKPQAAVSHEQQGILYVDGEEEESSEDEAIGLIEGPDGDVPMEEDDELEEDDFNPQPQGDSDGIEDVDDDEEEDEEGQEAGLLDIEAEETDDDDDDDDEEDEIGSDVSEVDDDEEEDDGDEDLSEAESEAAIRVAKPQTLNRKR